MAFSSFQIFGEKQFFNSEKLGGLASNIFLGTDLINGQGNLFQKLARLALGGYGFIVDTVTKERLIFQYNVDIKETGGAEYTTHQTIARSVPQYQYKGGKERVLNMPITFTMQEVFRDDVRRSVRWLQSLAYPTYSGSEVDNAPHPVVVVQGRLYTKDTWIVKDFEVSWGQARDPVTQMPNEATVNLTLVEVSNRGKTKNDLIFI